MKKTSLRNSIITNVEKIEKALISGYSLAVVFLLVSGFQVNAQTAVLTSSMTPVCLNGCNSAQNEAVKNVSDGNVNTKFLDFNKLNTGFYVNTNTASVVTKIDITSANDASERDPSAFTLKGSNNGTTWTNIYSSNISCNAARLNKQSFSFSNSTSYSWYQVLFSTVCNAASANAMQIAEVQLFKTSGVLPIKLVSFDGQLKNNNAELAWTIAQAEPYALYEIQHSRNGIDFSTIHKVSEIGQSTRFSYNDRQIAKGLHYYRLKNTDRAGEITYSQIISIKVLAGGSGFSVYPNPAKPGDNIKVVGNTLSLTGWTLYNISGKKEVMNRGDFGGNTTIQLPETISKGIYVLQLAGKNETITQKIIVE